MTDKSEPFAIRGRSKHIPQHKQGDTSTVGRDTGQPSIWSGLSPQRPIGNIRSSIHRWLVRLFIAAIVIGGSPLYLIGGPARHPASSAPQSSGKVALGSFAEWAEHETHAPLEPVVSHE